MSSATLEHELEPSPLWCARATAGQLERAISRCFHEGSCLGLNDGDSSLDSLLPGLYACPDWLLNLGKTAPTFRDFHLGGRTPSHLMPPVLADGYTSDPNCLHVTVFNRGIILNLEDPNNADETCWLCQPEGIEAPQLLATWLSTGHQLRVGVVVAAGSNQIVQIVLDVPQMRINFYRAFFTPPATCEKWQQYVRFHRTDSTLWPQDWVEIGPDGHDTMLGHSDSMTQVARVFDALPEHWMNQLRQAKELTATSGDS